MHLVPQSHATIVAIGTDITESHQLQENLLRAQRLETIGTLSAGIAHDLNNVLMPIAIAVEMMGDEQLGELAQFKTVIANGCSQATAIVKQLLALSRGQKDDSILLQPREALTEVISLVRGVFPKRIKFVEKVDPDLWMIRGNPTQLHQIIMNLAVNARDAMPGQGSIHINAENIHLDEDYCRQLPEARPGEFVKISVRDTGTGIPPEILAKIWLPFFTTKPEGKGTGLGLPTVKRLVEEENSGFLRLVSQPNHGTSFELFFPSAESQQTFGPTYQQGNGEAVLVLEPDTAVRSAVELHLANMGFTPLAVRSLADIRSQARQSRANARIAIVDTATASIVELRQRLTGTVLIAHTNEYGSAEGLDIRIVRPASRTQLASALYRAQLRSLNIDCQLQGVAGLT